MASDKPQFKTLTTDVLVIGAGGAGLRAAIEAKNQGANAKLFRSRIGELDKNPRKKLSSRF